MDDTTPVGFNRRDAIRIENSVLGYEHQIIPGPSGRRRPLQAMSDADSTDGNGNSSGPCGCCNCLDCIDLCTARDEDVVTDCAACGTAVTQYTIDVGNWGAFPNLAGSFVLNHISHTCTWTSANLSESGGVYQWVLTMAGGSSTLQLQYVSGSDPVHLLNGWSQTKFVVDGEWNCLCASKMKIDHRERVRKPAGLNCSVCVIPTLAAQNPTCPTIPASHGTIPCFPVVNFPSLTFLFSDPDPHHWACTGGSHIPGCTGFTFPYGFEGTTVRAITMARAFDEHCPWVGGFREVAIEDPVFSNGVVIGGHGGVTFGASVSYTSGDVGFSFYSYQGLVEAQYHLDPASWVIGVNTLTLATDFGSSSVVTWPATIKVTATDCMYSSTHPDYGYGCGYGVTGTNPADCGDSCDWEWANLGAGVLGWAFRGGVGIDFCASCGGCPQPAFSASVLGTRATTYCAGR